MPTVYQCQTCGVSVWRRHDDELTACPECGAGRELCEVCHDRWSEATAGGLAVCVPCRDIVDFILRAREAGFDDDEISRLYHQRLLMLARTIRHGPGGHDRRDLWT